MRLEALETIKLKSLGSDQEGIRCGGCLDY